jgi:transcriptional regulator with XRE-family HTH domain
LTIFIPALPFCKSELKAPKPLPNHYPQTLTTLGDHFRKKRLDLKLLQTDVAKILGADADTVAGWEANRTKPSLPFIPKIIEFLGYVPLSILPENQGERIAFCRKLAGLSQEELAHRLRIDPGTLRKWEKERGLHSERYEKVAAFLVQALHEIEEIGTH